MTILKKYGFSAHPELYGVCHRVMPSLKFFYNEIIFGNGSLTIGKSDELSKPDHLYRREADAPFVELCAVILRILHVRQACKIRNRWR